MLVRPPDVGDRVTVRDHITVEAPLAAQEAVEQVLAGTGRLAVDRVVGAHHGGDVGLTHERFEGRQVGLAHVLERGLGVEAVALRFRAAVDRVVFGGRGNLQVAWIVSLDALHKGNAHARGEIGVLAVGLLAAPPARVANEVDVRAEHREAAKAVDLACAAKGLRVLRTCFVSDCGRDAQHQLRIERRCEADRLWEDGRLPGHGHAVKGFAPVLVRWKTEPRDRRRAVHQLRRLLLEGHARDEVADARLETGVRVFPQQPLLGLGDAHGGERDGAQCCTREEGAHHSVHGHLVEGVRC